MHRVNKNRVISLTDYRYPKGPIMYWMSRDQRADDNWALLFAQEVAKQHNTYVIVVFCLRNTFEFSTERLIYFMLDGLKEVEQVLYEKNIPFYFILGNPADEMPKLIKKQNAGVLVSDFSPLRYNRTWKEKIAERIEVPFYEVDTHNIVPVWYASQKQEFGAYTLRPKLHKLLPEFLEDFPDLQKQIYTGPLSHTNWEAIYKSITTDASVKRVDWILPGEKAAHHTLEVFIKERLTRYATDRSDPTKHALSDLSPYLHFGNISAQRIALEIGQVKGATASKDAFLEELIVRKELSDNYCYYNKNYDNSNGFPHWAHETHLQHENDKREYIYSLTDLEMANTHDALWNAAQKEMIAKGKMHGYMRMYWAKKILEWSPSVEIAQKHANYLNDKYFLDGRDPNGYTGIAWSLGGVHDRPWFERHIFGKIRYMSYNGAKKKFSLEEYISSV